MEKIIELKPLFRQDIIFMGIMLLLITFGGIYIGLKYNTIFLVVIMSLLYIADLIQTSNIIEFYQDRVEIQNMLTKKIKIFKYESIFKIEFNMSKRVSFIKIKLKNGKNVKKHCACTKRKMQEAEEKFWDAFPHLS